MGPNRGGCSPLKLQEYLVYDKKNKETTTTTTTTKQDGGCTVIPMKECSPRGWVNKIMMSFNADLV